MSVKYKDEMANPIQTWAEVNSMEYFVIIKWGHFGEQTNTYGFNTHEELEAFRWGVQQAIDELDYEVTE